MIAPKTSFLHFALSPTVNTCNGGGDDSIEQTFMDFSFTKAFNL